MEFSELQVITPGSHVPVHDGVGSLGSGALTRWKNKPDGLAQAEIFDPG